MFANAPRLLLCALLLTLFALPTGANAATTTVAGTLHVVHADDAPGQTEPNGGVRYSVETANGTVVDILGLDGPAAAMPNSSVVVRGTLERSGAAIRVRSALDITIVAPPGQAPGQANRTDGTETTPSLGNHTLLVVLVDSGVHNGPAPLPTQEEQRARIFDGADSVNGFYQESTNGRFTLSGHVTPWLSLPGHGGCATGLDGPSDSMQQQEFAAATDAGYEVTNYEYWVIVYSNSCAQGPAGLGRVGGAGAWAFYPHSAAHTIIHELGHNLGLYHSNRWECTTPAGAKVSLGGTCTVDEYGDPYDEMGGDGSLNGYQKAALDWLPDANVTTVPGSGTYSIAASDLLVAQPQLLRVYREIGEQDIPSYLYVDLRTPGGTWHQYQDAWNADATTGVSVRTGLSHTAFNPINALIDMYPDDDYHATLQPGTAFTDPLSGVTITADAVNVAGATAQVTVTTPPGWVDRALTWRACTWNTSRPEGARKGVVTATSIEVRYDPICNSNDGRRVELRMVEAPLDGDWNEPNIVKASTTDAAATSLVATGLKPATRYRLAVLTVSGEREWWSPLEIVTSTSPTRSTTGACTVRRAATIRADKLVGCASADVLRGGRGNDSIRGMGGNDRLFGDAGNDVIDGGVGGDTIEGGTGADRITSRDGRKDTVRCGRGRDSVTADRVDRVARDCERVNRR